MTNRAAQETPNLWQVGITADKIAESAISSPGTIPQ